MKLRALRVFVVLLSGLRNISYSHSPYPQTRPPTA